MPTYIYKCPVHGTFEEFHSINTTLTECPLCLKEDVHTPITRLIGGNTTFILVGSGWAKDNYK